MLAARSLLSQRPTHALQRNHDSRPHRCCGVEGGRAWWCSNSRGASDISSSWQVIFTRVCPLCMYPVTSAVVPVPMSSSNWKSAVSTSHSAWPQSLPSGGTYSGGGFCATGWRGTSGLTNKNAQPTPIVFRF